MFIGLDIYAQFPNNDTIFKYINFDLIKTISPSPTGGSILSFTDGTACSSSTLPQEIALAVMNARVQISLGLPFQPGNKNIF